MSTKADLLKQAIINRIRSGAHPVGARLPSLRSAAGEFGVHLNTVAKAYGELADLGIVRTVHGRGTFVLGVPTTGDHQEAVDEIFAALRDLATQSRHLGLTRRDWSRLAADAEAAGYEGEETSTWFIECSPKDTDELAASLSTLLELSVRPMLVDDLPHHLVASARSDNLFITTPFHVEEVEDAVAGQAPVVTVNVVPTSGTLVQLARIDPSSEIAVVASNAQTLERLVAMVHLYTRRDPVVAMLVGAAEAPELAGKADVLIDSQSIHAQVLAWRPRGAVLTVRYQIEPTSLAYLREVLRRKAIEGIEVTGD